MAQSPYELLLNRILFGEYAPGASLVERDIAKELRISRTPVREALLRLRLEGLVEIIPRGGVFVVEASVQLIREVTEVRLVLEEYLAHLVVQRRTEKWLEEFRQWLNELEPIWHGLSPRERMKKDSEFHAFLDKAACNEVLSDHIGLLRRQVVLFWGQSIQESLEGVLADFKDTLKAARERESQALAGVFRRHVLDHVERVQSYMNPEEFRRTSLGVQP